MGLILGIIGILVIAAGIGASVYFGGDSYTDSIQKGEAVKSINQAEQISTMISIYKANNLESPSDLDTVMLDTYYNRSGDKMGWIYDSPTNKAYKLMSSEEQCVITNKELGYEGPAPTCDAIPADLADEKYHCCIN